MLCCVFFCKKKTVYEMRIRYWSSYGCSSDLVGPLASGFWRLALAAPLLLLLAPMTGQALPRLDRRLVAIIWIAGAAFALDLAFWHEGILRTRLANSTLVGNATSFAFAGWGYIIARRLPSRTAPLALTLAFLEFG